MLDKLRLRWNLSKIDIKYLTGQLTAGEAFKLYSEEYDRSKD